MMISDSAWKAADQFGSIPVSNLQDCELRSLTWPLRREYFAKGYAQCEEQKYARIKELEQLVVELRSDRDQAYELGKQEGHRVAKQNTQENTQALIARLDAAKVAYDELEQEMKTAHLERDQAYELGYSDGKKAAEWQDPASTKQELEKFKAELVGVKRLAQEAADTILSQQQQIVHTNGKVERLANRLHSLDQSTLHVQK